MMVSIIQKEFITELRESGDEFENIVIGTFSLEASFFEEIFLDILSKKDAKNIMVLVDRRNYEDTFGTAKEAGRSYLIEPVKAFHRFHPKFILLTSEDSGKLFIGSGNITANGVMRNGEIFSLIDLDLSRENPEIINVLKDMKGFFSALSSNNLLASLSHREKVESSLSYAWLAEHEIEPNKGKIKLLHSVEHSILSQLKKVLDEEEVNRITIASPFFDSRGKLLTFLTANFSDKIRLLVQPDAVRNLPVERIRDLNRKGNQISVYKTWFKNDESRYMHAKIIIFETENGTYCLTGSANATVSGLLSSSKAGNIELCLLRHEKKRSYFDYLLQNDDLGQRKVKIGALKSNLLESETLQQSYKISINEAQLQSDNLLIRFSPGVGGIYKQLTATLVNSRSIDPIILSKKLLHQDHVIFPLESNQKQFCEQSAYVKIKLKKSLSSREYLESNKRWISTQHLEQTPRNRDIRQIEETNGRIGLIRLMNQLLKASETPSIFLYYLRYLNFDWLAETLNSARRRIFQQALGETEGTSGAADFEREIVTATEVLEKLVNRHEKKFDALLEQVDGIEDFEERIMNMFDLFLFLSKIVIWFMVNQEYDYDEIDDIISRMESLVGTRDKYWYIRGGFGYFDRIKKTMEPMNFDRIYQRLNVPLHFLVLSSIIQQLVKEESTETRSEIRDRLSCIIRFSFSQEDVETALKETIERNFEKVAREYKEYEVFKLSKKKIIKTALKLFEDNIPEGACSRCSNITHFRMSTKGFICPKCAKNVAANIKRYYLMECYKCGNKKWMAARSISPIEFCETDGMKLYLAKARIFIP